MDVMRKKESVNQSINLSENFASWLMMMMLKGYVEDAQKSRVKHEAARRKLWFFFFLAAVQFSVAHMKPKAVFVKSKKNREEEALNKNCSS